MPSSALSDAVPAHPLHLAFDGARIDGWLFTDVTNAARSAPGWFDTLVKYWSAYGMVVFAVLLLAGWWLARRGTPETMARVVFTPVTVVAVYVVNDLLKSVVQELRPCRQLPHTFHIEACAAPTDWAFPSNHTVVAFSAATALLLIHRRLGSAALVVAVAMGASRVWVGAHYPHDVAAGVVVGVCLAVPLTRVAGRLAPRVERARDGRLGPVLVSSRLRAGRHAAAPPSATARH